MNSTGGCPQRVRGRVKGRFHAPMVVLLVTLMPGVGRSQVPPQCPNPGPRPSGSCCPTGTNWKGGQGYPDLNKDAQEQTGSNLYRTDQFLVYATAANAVATYCSYCNNPSTWVATPTSPPNPFKFMCPGTDPKNPTTPPTTTCRGGALNSDQMIEAVSFHVSLYMTYRNSPDLSDLQNATVFKTLGYGAYLPANLRDWPQPADLTLQISGKAVSGVDPCPTYYCGDCEDQAILRAALLRAPPFCLPPASIWGATNSAMNHEYNIVQYKNAYRVMDGLMTKNFNSDSNGSHQSSFGWNEVFGPRDSQIRQHDYLVEHTNNCPPPKTPCAGWNPNNYFAKTCPCS